MKYQVLFSLKNNEKVQVHLFINVVCCSRDWRFKGQYLAYFQVDGIESQHRQELLRW